MLHWHQIMFVFQSKLIPKIIIPTNPFTILEPHDQEISEFYILEPQDQDISEF